MHPWIILVSMLGSTGPFFWNLLYFLGKPAFLLGKRRVLGGFGKGKSGEMSWRRDRRGVTVLEIGNDGLTGAELLESSELCSFGDIRLNKEFLKL